jgi:hypothetical protein
MDAELKDLGFGKRVCNAGDHDRRTQRLGANADEIGIATDAR